MAYSQHDDTIRTLCQQRPHQRWQILQTLNAWGSCLVLYRDDVLVDSTTWQSDGNTYIWFPHCYWRDTCDIDHCDTQSEGGVGWGGASTALCSSSSWPKMMEQVLSTAARGALKWAEWDPFYLIPAWAKPILASQRLSTWLPLKLCAETPACENDAGHLISFLSTAFLAHRRKQQKNTVDIYIITNINWLYINTAQSPETKEVGNQTSKRFCWLATSTWFLLVWHFVRSQWCKDNGRKWRTSHFVTCENNCFQSLSPPFFFFWRRRVKWQQALPLIPRKLSHRVSP